MLSRFVTRQRSRSATLRLIALMSSLSPHVEHAWLFVRDETQLARIKRALESGFEEKTILFRIEEENEPQRRQLEASLGPVLKAALTAPPDLIVGITSSIPSALQQPGENAFNLEAYFSQLHTKEFGQLLLYSPQVSSTQTLLYKNFTNFPQGLLFVTDAQTSGRGRGSNTWVSPPGCLMFSFKCIEHKGSHLSFFQYLVSLAVVRAASSGRGRESIDVRLKWPNDIYAGEQKLKIGGVLCQSNWWHGIFDITVGVGLNISNAQPTTCINDLLKRNCAPETPPFTTAEFLASFCGHFERMFLDTFLENGFASFIDEYLKRWLHTDQRVEVHAEASDVSDGGGSDVKGKTKTVVIKGLTKSGFLRAESLDGKKTYELHPDGNSLDFLQGLIKKKIR